MEVKTIGYVVQYAVYKELCSTNLFLDFLFIGTFFNKILLKLSSWVCSLYWNTPIVLKRPVFLNV